MAEFGIPDELMELKTYSADALPFVDTIAKKTGITDEKLVRNFKRGLAEGLQSTRVWISGENEIEGFRRMAMLVYGKMATLYAVNASGAFGIFTITQPRSDENVFTKLSIGDILKSVLSGDPSFSTRFEAREVLNINHFASASYTTGKTLLNLRERSLRTYVNDAMMDSSVDYRPFFARLSSTMEARAMRNNGGIRVAMKAALNPDVVAAAWSVKRTASEDVMWLTGVTGPDSVMSFDAFKNADTSIISRNRCQAIRAYPAFSGSMIVSKEEGNHIREMRSALRAHIDQGVSFKSDLAALVGLPEHMLDKIQGKGRRSLGVNEPKDMSFLLSMALMDPNQLPKNVHEWRALVAVSKSAATHFNEATEFSRLDRMEDAEEKTAHNLSVLSKDWVNAHKRFPDIMNNGVRDVAESVAKLLVVPMIFRNSGGEGKYFESGWEANILIGRVTTVLKSRLFLNASMKDANEISQKWHRNIQRMTANLGSTMKDRVVWKPLLGNKDIQGVTVREITSPMDLRLQGKLENHCVGGYSGHVTRAGAGTSRPHSVIFSIEKDGKILSTAEFAIRFEKDKKTGEVTRTVTLSQNMAHSNTQACEVSQAVVKALGRELQTLSAERHQTYESRMGRTREELDVISRQSSSVLESACDIAYDEDYIDKAWDEMSQYLPKRDRMLGMDDYLETILSEVRSLDKKIDEMKPVNRFNHQTQFFELEPAF